MKKSTMKWVIGVSLLICFSGCHGGGSHHHSMVDQGDHPLIQGPEREYASLGFSSK